MDHDLKGYTPEMVVACLVDTPPVLDGKLDDACWKEAYACEDFRLTRRHFFMVQKNQADRELRKTKFHVLCDSRFLCFGIECYEEAMDALRSVAFFMMTVSI